MAKKWFQRVGSLHSFYIELLPINLVASIN